MKALSQQDWMEIEWEYCQAERDRIEIDGVYVYRLYRRLYIYSSNVHLFSTFGPSLLCVQVLSLGATWTTPWPCGAAPRLPWVTGKVLARGRMMFPLIYSSLSLYVFFLSFSFIYRSIFLQFYIFFLSIFIFFYFFFLIFILGLSLPLLLCLMYHMLTIKGWGHDSCTEKIVQRREETVQ